MRLHRRLEGRKAQEYWYRVRDRRERVYNAPPKSPLSQGKGYLLGTFVVGRVDNPTPNPIVEVWYDDDINGGIAITEVYIYAQE